MVLVHCVQLLLAFRPLAYLDKFDDLLEAETLLGCAPAP